MCKKGDGKLESEALLPTLFVPMTGEAEESREVKPDPANPRLVNGSFEEVIGEEEPKPRGWHYQRQAKLIEAGDAPEGKRYLAFSNSDTGREAQALQAFAADGRKVRSIDVSLWVKGDAILPGAMRDQRPPFGWCSTTTAARWWT